MQRTLCDWCAPEVVDAKFQMVLTRFAPPDPGAANVVNGHAPVDLCEEHYETLWELNATKTAAR